MEQKINQNEWMDAANSVDQGTIEEKGPEYPYIQWANGNRQLKSAGGVLYTGGLFISEAQSAGADLAGWVKGELTHKSGEVTAGAFIRDLTVAVIRLRRCWMADGRRFPWAAYDDAVTAANGAGSPKGKAQALVLVKGWQSPIVLTMSGTVSAAFVGSRNTPGVLQAFDAKIVKEANSLNLKRGVKSKFPYRAFWLTVGPARNADGSPIFTEVGKAGATSVVTLPTAIGLPEKPQGGDLAKVFVGAELLASLNAAYADAETWAHAWDAASVQEDAPSPTTNEDVPF